MSSRDPFETRSPFRGLEYARRTRILITSANFLLVIAIPVLLPFLVMFATLFSWQSAFVFFFTLLSIPTALLARYLARCRFPPASTPVHCAVSGGPDSFALLVLALAAECVPTVIHVEHRLRPESDAEAELVERVCADLGVPVERRAAPVDPGSNLEARARSARYARCAAF